MSGEIKTILILGAVSIPALAVLRAYAFAKVWAWLAVPLFGVPEIGMLQAFVLAVFVRLFFGRNEKNEGKDHSERLKNVQGSIIESMLASLIALGIGWAIHAWGVS